MAEPRGTRPVPTVMGTLLILFGALSILSVGLLFVVAGTAFLVAGLTHADREQPRIYWPIVAGVGAFLVGYVLVAPMTCWVAATGTEGGTEVVNSGCRSLLGVAYPVNASHRPAVGVGAAAALAGSVAVWWRLGDGQR